MKKGLSILFAAALLTGFVSCGPSAEDKKADSLLQDSLAKEADATGDWLIDSMMRADSIATAQADSAAKADSARKADSAAKAGK